MNSISYAYTSLNGDDMIDTFLTLKNQYESQELTLDDLNELKQYRFIKFKNNGISRSNLDCLYWEITCSPYADFLEQLTTIGFPSLEILNEYLNKRALGLFIDKDDDNEYVCLTTCHKKIEIIASIGKDGSIYMDVDDIELRPSFQIFLRVQH